jgi:hypothetical protein
MPDPGLDLDSTLKIRLVKWKFLAPAGSRPDLKQETSQVTSFLHVFIIKSLPYIGFSSNRLTLCQITESNGNKALLQSLQKDYLVTDTPKLLF